MIVGIDLGTTNSAVAIWRDGRAELLPNALGDYLTPSAVSIGDDGALLVGMAARERQATHPDRTATAFKRFMGTKQSTRLGKRDFSAEELSALVLASLKADAEAALGEPITRAVITVPAYFNDRQRKATQRAGQLAGLTVERLLNEPTAAALAYGIETREEREPFLVFDLGGGTFDVSIVEMFSGIVEVRASAGDNRLGGEDFNAALAEIAVPKLEKAGLSPDADRLRIPELVRVAAERARRQLTDRDTAEFVVTFDGQRYETEVTDAEFEAQAAPLLARLREPVLRSLRDSNIRVADLSEVVLVGGGTRMPIVRRTITRMFGRFPNATVHPDHAIALGAAVQAGLKARDAALDEIRLTDVCPFTLGIEIGEPDGRGGRRDGIFSPIIERNTPVPASRVQSYSTIAKDQPAVHVKVYQGEARDVARNVWLGDMNVSMPRGPAGQTFECRFSYDTSGLLEVDVHVPASGLRKNMMILDETDAVSPAEIDKRRAALAALKQHPREDSGNAATSARAARVYESFIGERRDLVGLWISQYEAVLDGQDPKRIAEARAALETQLDELEGERYL